MFQINNIIETFRSQRFHATSFSFFGIIPSRSQWRLFIFHNVCFSHSAEIISFVNCVKRIYGLAGKTKCPKCYSLTTVFDEVYSKL